MSNASVIGVDCRYSTAGLRAKTAAAATAAVGEPVARAAIRASPHAVIAKATTETATANAPVL